MFSVNIYISPVFRFRWRCGRRRRRGVGAAGRAVGAGVGAEPGRPGRHHAAAARHLAAAAARPDRAAPAVRPVTL